MKILVLPGDGIGPEITAATLDVLTAADERCGLGLEFETRDIGWASLATAGTTLPQPKCGLHASIAAISGPLRSRSS